MSVVQENTLSFQDQMEEANQRKLNAYQGKIHERPLTVEEMLKQRDAESENIKYGQPLTLEGRGIKAYVEKSNEQRMKEMMNKNEKKIDIPIYKFCLGDEEINCNLTGIRECYPPIYVFGPGVSLHLEHDGLSLPDDFVFTNKGYWEFNNKKVAFKMEYGIKKYEIEYRNKAYMISEQGRKQDERYESLGIQYQFEKKMVIFGDKDSNFNQMVFEYVPEKNILKYVSGSYHISVDMCEVFKSV